MPTLIEPISVTSATITLTKNHMAGGEIYLNRAAGIALTLPAPDAGLSARFIVGTAPATGDYVIGTNGSANIIVIGVNELEVDTNDDGPYDADADAVTLVQAVAVVGDYLDFRCDGTKWYVEGQTNADGGVTTATT
jgi:hypothetical protein